MPVKNGLIVMWSGAIINIPPGWHLCNGEAGTPDLRGKFIVGAGSGYAPRDEGGANTHKHNYTSDGHIHSLAAGTGLYAGSGYNYETDGAQVVGETEDGDSRPPYYALCFIMSI